LPIHIQKITDKKLVLFMENPYHPSFNTKKLKGENNIWQGRINIAYRFVFQIKGDVFSLLSIFRHK